MTLPTRFLVISTYRDTRDEQCFEVRNCQRTCRKFDLWLYAYAQWIGPANFKLITARRRIGRHAEIIDILIKFARHPQRSGQRARCLLVLLAP